MSEFAKNTGHRNPVYADLPATLLQAEGQASGATALMSLAAFFAPDNIPVELFQQDAALYPNDLERIVLAPERLAELLGVLDDLSLIDFNQKTRTFSIHRMVQSAAHDALGAERDRWAQRAAGIVVAAFPEPAPEAWEQCERLVAHVGALNSQLPAEAATRELGWLLGAAGVHMRERAALADALPLFEASLAIFQRLATADPEKAVLQRDLAVSHERVGDVLRAEGKRDAARASYQASLAIFERLAEADHGKAGLQRDLAVSHEKIGDIVRAQGDRRAALAAYQTSLAIFERLATAEGSVESQSDLAVSHIKVGDALVAQGSLSEALAAYQASLRVREGLATADPGNTGWQQGLALSHGRIGLVFVKQGERRLALTAFRKGRDLIAQMLKQSPDNSSLPKDVAWFNGQIAFAGFRSLGAKLLVATRSLFK